MLAKLKRQGLTEGRARALIEQFVSNDESIYSVEDDRFLYYAQEDDDKTVRIFHIVKGKFDYSMEIERWEEFATLMASVSDDFFLSGEGKEFRECFLGNFLSKYDRRKEFISELVYIIDDAKGWLSSDKERCCGAV